MLRQGQKVGGVEVVFLSYRPGPAKPVQVSRVHLVCVHVGLDSGPSLIVSYKVMTVEVSQWSEDIGIITPKFYGNSTPLHSHDVSTAPRPPRTSGRTNLGFWCS